MDIVLIRHPALAVDPGVCYGRLDLALADAPDAAAQVLAGRLASLGTPPPPLALLTSPLVRCASVAACLGARLGAAPQPEPRLREIDFGAWEGRRWDDIGPAALDAWAADLLHARAHGGESVAQCAARVGQWFDEWIASAAPSTVALTHAGIMRLVAARALAAPIEETLRWPIAMAGIVWLRRSVTGEPWQLVRWNA